MTTSRLQVVFRFIDPTSVIAALAVFFLAVTAESALATPIEIDLDMEVSGEIAAGEERIYRIGNVVQAQRVYLQRLATDNRFQLNWLLEDSVGRVIEQNLAQIDDLGPVSLMGGDYFLTIRGETPTTTGTFTFVVHGLDDTVSTLSLDTLDTRELTGPGATHAYDLPIAEAGPVQLFFDEASPSQISYRLTDELGNLRQDWTTSTPAITDPVHLPTGTHRIEVRGRNGYEGLFSLQVRPIAAPVSIPLTLNGSANYASSDVTETTRFEFSLDDPTPVYISFSIDQATSAGQWRLDRADGQEISGWSGNMSWPAERWNLIPGDYILSVRSRLSTPITGSVILHEVVDTEAVLSPDMPVTAELLIPAQHHRFDISALPAGIYLLDRLDTDNNSNLGWRLDDALGRTLLQTANVNDVESIALRGGDYTLTVTGKNGANGFVDFSLTTVTVVETMTSLGGVIDDAIVLPGEIRRYSFTAPSDRMLSIERQAASSAGSLNYMLHDAVGREIISRTTTLPVLTDVNLAGGDYVLTVMGEGGATGSYTLALTDNGPTGFTPSGTPLLLDELAQGTISSGSLQQWMISLGGPERVYFELVEGAVDLNWTLFDRSGQALFDSVRARFPGTDDRGAFLLAAGDYTVEFELTSGGPADYAFRAVDAGVTETVINLDEVIDSAPTVPGFRDDYLFTVPADGQFYFELLQGDNQLRWQLEHSSGEIVFGSSVARFNSESRGPFSLAAGDYRLSFEASSIAATVYQFQVHSVIDLEDTLSLGATPVPVNDTMAMPGQSHNYALTIEPGVDTLYVQVQSGNNSLRYSLFDPAGRALIDNKRLLFPVTDDSGPVVITPGEYRLVVDMTSPVISNYALTLHAPQSASAEATALDQLETLQLPGSGAEQRYLLDLNAPSTRTFFDPAVNAANVLATLTHLPSGWQPFSDVSLAVAINADRGPWSLPPGDYELALRALANPSEASWTMVSVVDENAGFLTVDEVIVTEFLTPGSSLSYSIEPDEDGQALIFDLMSPASNNRWVLQDPVGTAVFGPANAANENINDQGPISLASGVYTLTFSNSENEPRDWLFRVASADSTIELPEGCAACSALDILFVFDTSPSMNPVNQAMCDLTADLVQALADDGIPVNSRFWGITQNGSASCLTGNVLSELGPTVPGSPPAWMAAIDQCEDGGAGELENWAPASAIVSSQLEWQEEAVRLLIPVADEGSYCGSPVNDFDIESVYFARQLAAQNDVVISPLVPVIAPDPVRAMAELITVGTGGISTVADFDLEDVLPVARAIAVSACGTAETIAVPQFTDLSPGPGSLLPSGVPLVLSGRVLPVNQFRPVLEVEVNGQPSSVLDGSGSFFATIQLEPGPNQVTISAQEACGPTVLEIELMGAGDDTDPWAGFSEVSDLLQARFSATTFDQAGQRLLVDVAADNPGAALQGPILMAVGVDMHPGVSLLNSDGQTPNGEPYVILVPEGEMLPAGELSATRRLVFSNPGLESIDFEPRWLLPANQAPHFTTVPSTRGTVGSAWRYAAAAEDGNGDSVTYSLLVAPAGMSLVAGELNWTPASAGSFDVVLRASDGRGGLARQSFSINVVEAGFNVPPFFTSTPPVQTPVGSSYGYQASVIDPDGDPVGYDLLSAPAGMDIDPVSGLVGWPNAQPGQHSVIIEADDGEGGQATQAFTLFVGEPATTPPGPVFSSVPVTYAAIETQYRYRYQLSPPQDPGPTVSLVQGPAAMSLDSVAGTLEWLPEAGDLGSHVVELLATDAAGQQASQRFDLTVLESLPNQAPYVTSSPPRAAIVDQPWVYPARAIDPEFETLTFSLAQAPPDMQVEALSGELSWTPPAGTPASVTVALLVTDPHGLAAEQVFDIDVRASNADPVLTSVPPSAAVVGQTYNHLFIASDADGDPLTFSLVDGPTGMTLDAEAGWLSWLTTGTIPGSYEFEIRVSDDWGGSTSQVFEITVVEDAEPPQVSVVMARQPACATEAVSVCLQASDNIGIASRELQIDGEIQALVSGCVEWTPAVPGNVPALATATDVSGLVDSESSELQVADCNDEQRPVVTLSTPGPDSLLIMPTPLVVSIDDNTPAALTWTVAIRSDESSDQEILAEGTGPVDESQVALIDPTRFPEGTYWISILGSDGVQTGGIEYRVNIGSGFKPGRLIFATADVTLPVAGIPLTFGRSYDSLDAATPSAGSGDDLGPGWRMTLSASVRDSVRNSPDPDNPLSMLLAEPFSDDTRVFVVKPNGERVGFTFAPRPRSFPALFQFDVDFEPDPGVTDTLRVVDGSQVVWALGAGYADFIIPYNPSIYELETEDRVVYVISEDKGLIEVRDALGGVLTVSDDGIVSSRGLSVDYIRDDQGRVTEIVLPPDQPGAERGRIHYAYDALGNLVNVTDLAGGVSTYEYADAAHPHHLTALLDALGNPVARHVYDDDGRLIAQCPADGDLATLDGCTQYEFDVSGGLEIIFDTNGFRSELFHDELGQLVARRDWVNETDWVEQVWIRDDAGRLIEYVDPEGGRQLNTYDERGNLLSRTYPGGQTFLWQYDHCDDEWIEATDPLGNTTRRSFDNNCRLLSQTDPLGGITAFEYNALGQRTGIIDPVGQTWSFTYNALGLIETLTDPLGGVETREYDDLGRETARVDRAGQRREFEYDDGGRLVSEALVGSSQVFNWEHNIRGLITRESGPDATLDIEYWPTGLIRRFSFSGPDAPSWWVDYEYDGNGNVIELADSIGGIVHYEYDGLDRLTAVDQSGTGINPKRVTFDYNKAGLVQNMNRFADLQATVPGPVTSLNYACPSCLTEPTLIDHRRPDNSAIDLLQFGRDANGQIVELTDAQGIHQFTYDGRGWLVDASHPPVTGLASGSYQYDPMGNWLSLPDRPGPVALSYGSGAGGHRLLDDGNAVYTYNQRGSLINRLDVASGQTLAIGNDGFDRPVAVSLLDQNDAVLSEASYRYLPSGPRVFADVDGLRRHFVFDGQNVIAALDDDGEVVWRRLHTRALDRPLAEEHAGQTRWLLTDHLGSIRRKVDDNGQTLAEFAYTPFGRQVLGPSPGLDDALRFTGREFDVPGDLGYYRARLYDPAQARFVSEDPLEPWHYRYGDNNPLRFTDPSGETVALELIGVLCTAAASISIAKSFGLVVEEALAQAADGLLGIPGDVDAILDKVRDTGHPKNLLPCGFGEFSELIP